MVEGARHPHRRHPCSSRPQSVEAAPSTRRRWLGRDIKQFRQACAELRMSAGFSWSSALACVGGSAAQTSRPHRDAERESPAEAGLSKCG